MRTLKLLSLCSAGALVVGCHDSTGPAPEARPDATERKSATALALSNTWSTKARMWSGRSKARAATIDGIIYVVGGYSGISLTATLQAYDVATNTWTIRKAMPIASGTMNGASVINGRLYVSNHDGRLYVYNPGTNSWARKADMPSNEVWGMGGGAQGVINGRLYVHIGHLSAASKFYRYNPGTNTWTTLQPPWAHSYAAAGVIGGKFYLAGGEEEYATVGWLHVYDPATNTWTWKAEMPVWLTHAASAVVNGKLYVAGGCEGNSWPCLTNILLVYNPATNRWARKSSMPTVRSDAAGAAAGGKFFVIGGDNTARILRTVEAYTP